MTNYRDKIREKYKKILFIHGWGFNHKIWEKFARSFMPLENCIFLDLYSCFDASEGDLKQAASKVLRENKDIDLVISWSLGCHLAKEIETLDIENSIKMVYISYLPKFVKSAEWKFGFDQSTIDELKINLNRNLVKTLKNFYLLMIGDLKNKTFVYKEIIPYINTTNKIKQKQLMSALEILEKSNYINFCKDKNIENFYIYGDKDLITPPTVEKFIKTLEPKSKTIILSGASHIPFISNSKDFFMVLNKYI